MKSTGPTDGYRPLVSGNSNISAFFQKVHLISADLDSAGSPVEAVRISQPDEAYHLAAQRFVRFSLDSRLLLAILQGLVTRVLETI